MVRPDKVKWDQTLADLRVLLVEAKESRSRERFQRVYEQLWRQEICLVNIDEAHIHRDMDLGFTETAKGKIAWRMSDSALFSDRISLFDACDFAA